MKTNYPTKPKTGGPEIHVEMIRIPTKTIKRKANMKTETLKPRPNQDPEMEKLEADLAEIRRLRKTGGRCALIAIVLALINILIVIGKALLK